MKHLRQRKLLVVLISVLVSCLVAGTVTLLVLNRREQTLEEQQNEALQELYDNQGRYDEQSIVLSGTTKPRAEELAKAFGAELRITEDGKFAALTLPEGVTVFDIYENDEYRKYIDYMSLDYQAKISDLLPSDSDEEEGISGERLPIRPQYTVSDTDYNRQTYLDYLNMSNVWNRTKGEGITVAVIDTGIDTDHPEFAGRISEYSYNASEDKIVKDYILSDGSYDWSLVEDEQGHGTAVAGVIAASMDGNGVVGIAPQVNIIVIKAKCDENGTFERTSDLVFGLYYAIERDVAVVNMSFGTPDPVAFAEPAQLAFDSDVICVAAAGNDATANLTYPAADENVFGIGALAADSWELASYSNYGENVDFVAPGTVYTTQMGGGYGGMNGTSFASPITAGVLALYLSQNKYQEFNTVEELIYASCYDLGDLGPDWYYGYGALDVSALMLEERGTVTFNMMTDELDNTEQVFIRSHTLQNMPEPERLYAIFDGWYYDPQCTDEYVWYEDEFYGDLTLYANWVNEEDGVPYIYVELDDGTIEIRSYTGHRRYITIPDYIDGKVVSSIGEFALKGETRLREVKLPKYLKRIRMSAFEGCSNLVSMEIPDTVTEIGAKAFYDNVRLSALVFGENSQLVSIGDWAFSGCAKMRTFTVPSNVTTLNATAFYRNTSMMAFDVQKGNIAFSAKDGVLFNYTGSTLVCYPAGQTGAYTVPEHTTTIGYLSFAFTRLSTVELSRVERLDDSSFIYGSLESIVIPDSVTSMGASVFAANGYLRSAKLGAGLTSISSGAFTATALTSIEIPAGIRSIDASAFADTALTSIEIPAGIRSIGDNAFASIGCLAEVNFAPNSTLTYIGKSAFCDSGVIAVKIPASVVTIDAYAFSASDFPYLSSLLFEENSALHTIGISAFASQSRLTSVDLPERLASLGDFAFSGTGLTTVDIPTSVTYFGAGAFASCHSLENIFVDDENKNYVDVDGVVYDTAQKVLVAYPAGNARTNYNILEGVTDIGEASFYGSIVQTVHCNQNLVTICSQAFCSAEKLRNIYFQEGLKHIQPYAFFGTCNIERIDLPNSVEILDEYSFCGCGAKQYTLSQNLRGIKAYALSQNARLTSIAIPDSVMQISNYVFLGDWNLSSVTFTANAKLPRISFGAFAYCGLTSFRVPANVSTMAQGAFMGCSKMQSFTLAKNSKLESISAYMFDGCSNLRTITFEEGSALTSIQAHGLEGMRNLTSIDFGDAKLTNIDNFAFRFCESLTHFDIPEGVTFLGRYAFYYCTNLYEVTIPSTMDFIGRFAFLGTNKLNVYFTSETLPANLAEDWDHGTKGYYLGVTDVVAEGDWIYAKLTSGNIAIIEYNGTATELDLTTLNLGGDIVNIGGGAFIDSTVERIVLPDTLQIIQAEAFYHSELKSVSIPASMTFIGRSAFAYTPIESLTFAPNAQVKTIEQSAFEKTEKLGSVVIPASVTTMGRAVFKNSGIISLTFADGFSMTEIPEEAFAYTHISTVTIPNSVTVINHNAFREIKELKSVTLGSGEGLMIMSNVFYQSGLETVYIPENVEYVGEYAFVGLSNLTEFTVSENNPFYKAVGGLLVSKNGRKLISVPAGRTGSLAVPEGIEVIGFGAFEDSKLSEIKFLDNANILSFGYRAFYNADGITEMHIPTSVVAIDYYAFAMCDNLQTVTFAEDNNLKGVYEGAFYGCKNLSNIMLPDSIVEISDFAFYGCRKLTDVPVSKTTGLKGIYDYAFAYAGFSGDYTTPETLIDIGPYAFMGNRFTSVTVPDTNYWDLIIGIGAFEDCQELTEITVPFIGASFEDGEITWFGYIFGAGGYEANATYVPESLKKVNISEEITFVGSHAFDGLMGLEEMSIPHSVQMVYEYAFNETTVKYELTNKITFVYYESLDVLNSSMIGKGISGHLLLNNHITNIYDSWPAHSAFKDCKNLTSITFEDNNQLTSLRADTFSGCSSLTRIDFGDNSQLNSINRRVFSGCSNLTHIDFGNNSQLTSIDEYAFQNCSSLTCIDFGDNSQLTSIVEYAFFDCSSLASIEIPNSVTSIGAVAFYGCSSLTNITIPDSMTSIGDSAFSHCSSLASIEIPDSVMSIGGAAFSGCSSLTSIEIPDSVTSIGGHAFFGCRSLTSITISDSVTSIGGEVFYQCSNLTSVDFGDNSQLTHIDYSAFYGCSSLTSITIPAGVTSISNYAFKNCSSLKSVEFGDNSQLSNIGDSAFYGCSSLTSVTIGDSVTSIGDFAFYGCSSLTSVTIGDSVTSIGEHAFSVCSSLTSVCITDIAAWCEIDFTNDTSNPLRNAAKLYLNGKLVTELVIPDGVTSIGKYAFFGCSSLTSIKIPDSVMSIADDAFYNCSILYVIYNHSDMALEIGSSAHGYIAQYAKLIIDKDGNKTYQDEDSGVEYVDTTDGFLFKQEYGMYHLVAYLGNEETVTLPKDIKGKPYEIYRMKGVRNVIIPDGVTNIGYYAFSDCSSLTSIKIPDSVTNIGYAAFSGCSSLASVYITNIAMWCDIDFTNDKSNPLCNAEKLYLNGKLVTELVIPDGVTSIGKYAFFGCSSLTSIKIPDSVTSIGGSAFSDCSSLTSIEIPDSVTSIGYYAFSDCSSLTSIKIPDSVTNIGYYAFSGCSKLTSVDFGDNSQLASIDNYAFSGCSSLTSMNIPESVTSIGFEVFSECPILKLTVSANNLNFTTIDGAVYNENVTQLIFVQDSVTSLCVPKTVLYFSLTGNTKIQEITFEKGSALMSIALSGCSSLTSIKIPAGITNLNLSGCSSLMRVDFENNSQLTFIGRNVFSGCSSLTSIDFGNNSQLARIDYQTFYNCSSLTSIDFGDNSQLTSIGSSAFSGCSSLTSVDFGDNSQLSSIGEHAFSGCSSLTSITIPDGVTSIGDSAFSGCSSLTSIEIPNGVTSIGDSAFYGCSSLTSIEIPNGVTSISNYAFQNCSSLASVDFGDNSQLTSIGYMAFFSCSSLKSIEIPGSVTDIDDWALASCRNLTSVDFGDNSQLTHIDYNAFYGCSSLTSITIPDSVTSIGEQAFSNCSSLTSVYITDIAAWCEIDFTNNTSNPLCNAAKLYLNGKFVTELVIPDGVTSIGKYAFSKCSSLTSIKIPDSVTSIGEHAFSGCSSLTSITIPDSVTSIGGSAFSGCSSLTSIEIPDGVTSIGSSVFSGCSSLTSLEISNGVTRIGYSAFYGCSSLTSITIPNSVTSIGDSAFYGCSSLTSIEIPDSMTSIGYYAFYNCSILHVIYNHSDMALKIGSSAYGYIAKYARLIIDKDGNKTYQGEDSGVEYVDTTDGFLFKQEYGRYHLVAYLGNEETVTLPKDINGHAYEIYQMKGVRKVVIPDSMMSISGEAFRGCSTLTSIEIPHGVTSIGSSAFSGCSSLTSIKIPDSVTSIGGEAFRGCSSLTSIEIPNGVTSIGSSAFSGCTRLTSIKIPDSVTSIGDSAFSGCTRLTSIKIPDSVTIIGSSAFSGCSSLTSIKIPHGVTSIGRETFRGCSSLTSIEIPNGVTSIGREAFCGCSSLTSIEIPNGVTSIGSSAFSDCSSLTSIEIPDSVTSIGATAFIGTAYYNDQTNWMSGTLYIGNHLIRVDVDVRYMEIKEGVVCVADGAYNDCYLLKNAVYIDYFGSSQDTTNLETIVIGGKWLHLPQRPSTLKFIVLGKNVQMFHYAFDGITGITIYVEANEKDVRWDENFPGWNNGNRVIYGDDWSKVKFYDQDNCLLSEQLVLNHQIVRQPYCEDYFDEQYRYVFMGYDLDGDGETDTISATTSIDISASAVYRKEYRCVQEGHVSETDADCLNDQVCNFCGAVITEKLGHDYQAVVTAPTCTEKGYMTHTCSRCDDSYIDSEVAALGHTAGAEADCVNDQICTVCGVLLVEKLGHAAGAEADCVNDQTCTVCGAVLTEKLGHDYNAVVTIPTCTEQGYTTHTCHCGDTYVDSYVDAWGHDTIQHSAKDVTCTEIGWYAYETCSRCDYTTYVERAVLGHDTINHEAQAPTCTEIGWKAYETCSRCYYTTYVEIPATGHSYNAVVTDPTCAEKGYTTHTCHCGDTYVDSYVDALGHDTIQHAAKAPTCIWNGWKAYETCSRCYYTTYVEIPATGHSFNAVVTDPTCAEKGYTTHTCRCGLTYMDSYVDALGHDYNTVVTAPTCTEKGYTTHTCAHCDDTYIDNEIEALGHKPGTEADCLNNQICTVCGVVLTEKLGHDYKAVVTAPTCTEEGYTTHTCSRCGDAYTDSKTDALGHKPGAEADCLNDQICMICGEILAGKLGHDYKSVVTDPTCTTDGYTTHTCSRCNDTYTDSKVEALGHKPGAEADCLNDQACTVCGVVLTEKLGHDYKAVITKPTCTENGYTTHTCSRCGDNYIDSEVDALGHKPGAEADCLNDQTCTVCGTILTDKLGHNYEAAVTDPTCTENGYTTHTCSRCDDTYTDSKTEALGHKPGAEADCLNDQICTVCGVILTDKLGHDYEAVVTDPTCTEEGYTTHTCSRCGDTYTDSKTDALGHKPGAEADCLNNQICTVCGVVLTEKLGHDYKAVVTAPTCTEEGYTTHTCSRCGDAYTDSKTDALGHKPGAEADCLNDQICMICGEILAGKLGHDYKSVVTDPTCTTDGYTTHTCSRCNDTYTDSKVEALGHKPGAEADCLNDQVCTVCGEILIGKLGHDYAAVVTNPTCTEKGYTTHTCSRCGDTYTDSETEALGHKPGDWIVDQEPAPGVEGSKHTACTVCGETLETAVIEALPVETESETQPVTDAEPDTEPVTTVPTDAGEETATAGETEKAPSGGGCAGNIHGISILFLLGCAAMISAVKRKKETE